MPGRVRQRPAQGELAVEQSRDGEQLVGESAAARARCGRPLEPESAQALARLGERHPGGGLHQRALSPECGHVVELREEAVDRAATAGVLGEGLAHDPAGEVDGERADLAAQLVDDLLPLAGQLLLAARDDPGRLLLRLGPQLLEDLLALGTGLVTDLRGLAAGLGQLARYCSSAALASACIASARSMPPSIASRRARKTCSKRGATYFANTK